MLAHLLNVNCQTAHEVALLVNDGLPKTTSLAFGWAVGPAGRAQHVWLRVNGQVVDLFGWTDHEMIGLRGVNFDSAVRAYRDLCDEHGVRQVREVFTIQ